MSARSKGGDRTGRVRRGSSEAAGPGCCWAALRSTGPARSLRLIISTVYHPDRAETWGGVTGQGPAVSPSSSRQDLENQCLLFLMPRVPPGGVLTLEETHPFKYLLSTCQWLLEYSGELDSWRRFSGSPQSWCGRGDRTVNRHDGFRRCNKVGWGTVTEGGTLQAKARWDHMGGRFNGL